jgi:hypothetical protein
MLTAQCRQKEATKMGWLKTIFSKSRIENELNEPARTVAIALKSWYRTEAKKWWRISGRTEGICDDGNEKLAYGEGYLRLGEHLACERCTDALLCCLPWDEALIDIERFFGPGVPPEIRGLAKQVTSKPTHKASIQAGRLDIDLDEPACFSCGNKLVRTDVGSLLGGSKDYLHYAGSICFNCRHLFCAKCLTQSVDTCPKCGGKMVTCYRKHLIKLQE